MRTKRFPLWTLLAAVLVVALVAGSGILSSGPPTEAQRAHAIESVLRCPSCEDLSVADSTAQTAVAVRATVDHLLSEGRTDQQIEAYLEARYGSSIVLDPPARGWPLLVWLLPLAAGLAAAAALGRLFLRRRAGAGPALDPDGAEPAPGRRQLEERKQFLLASLADADAEYLAGDLADGDYLSLRQRDLVHLSAVEARLAGVAPGADREAGAGGCRPTRSRSSRTPTAGRPPWRPTDPPGDRHPAGAAGCSAGPSPRSPPPSSWPSRCSPPTGCPARPPRAA